MQTCRDTPAACLILPATQFLSLLTATEYGMHSYSYNHPAHIDAPTHISSHAWCKSLVHCRKYTDAWGWRHVTVPGYWIATKQVLSSMTLLTQARAQPRHANRHTHQLRHLATVRTHV